ncbi:MAG: hypothetical protein ACYTFO_09235, partial [Planctomycetota bacterium]
MRSVIRGRPNSTAWGADDPLTDAASPSKPVQCEVRPVRGRADLRAFERIGRHLRSQQAGWIAPLKLMERQLLDRRRHAFYEGGEGGEAEFFLARNDRGKPIGRIGAIINHRYDAKTHQPGSLGEGIGFFGFFDCVNCPGVAGALIAAAGNWLRTKGRKEMIGPASPSETYDYGLLVEGFDQPHRFLSAFQPA